ncbi:hypothetical protein IMZ08_05390 [Bacillus luteolus]|uniref:Uncharacterized protein n=1 Tax=Litchfieldia luteola TaxID=682179 RepID=A0ABR9QG71_9BACI|nr:hypothetical protein [Cytobacillus luteolus]MBE4907496.1 hypothetical protein [Cytobacillus luteolus]MBP1944264.1 hypothetical protein [Cytobacillus luteolus]
MIYDVIIVGASQAGLAMCYYLKKKVLGNPKEALLFFLVLVKMLTIYINIFYLTDREDLQWKKMNTQFYH